MSLGDESGRVHTIKSHEADSSIGHINIGSIIKRARQTEIFPACATHTECDTGNGGHTLFLIEGTRRITRT